ncbi:MAG TPA: HD domain-containing phosphohydrolase, partial [Pyrinomonadaceae bacterium]
MREALEAMTRALLAAQTTRDLETGGHTPRVRRLALRLARELSLTGDDLRAVEYGALLHDIGKIGTPDRVLRKPGPHTPAEKSVMRGHVAAGALLLRSLGFPESIVTVVEQHHERWDGAGYPRSLRR